MGNNCLIKPEMKNPKLQIPVFCDALSARTNCSNEILLTYVIIRSYHIQPVKFILSFKHVRIKIAKFNKYKYGKNSSEYSHECSINRAIKLFQSQGNTIVQKQNSKTSVLHTSLLRSVEQAFEALAYGTKAFYVQQASPLRGLFQ